MNSKRNRLSFILLVAFVSMFSTVSQADFSQLSHRYLSPIDFELKIEKTLPIELAFAREFQKMGFDTQAGMQTQNCLVTAPNSSASEQALNNLGADNPSTGHPVTSTPTFAFLNQVTSCLNDALSGELYPANFSGNKTINGISQTVPEKFFVPYDRAFDAAVVARYFRDLKYHPTCTSYSNGTTKCQKNVRSVSDCCGRGGDALVGIQEGDVEWYQLTQDSKKRFILNLVNIVYGDVNVLVDDGYFKNQNDVISQTEKNAISNNDSSLSDIAQAALKYLMLRDEFLSY